jgi:hypothetical protein
LSAIEELKDVIFKLYGVKATHRQSVPVKEVFKDKTIWDGVVEVFDLHGHRETDTAYAWSHATDDPAHPARHVTVLHIPPAVSPETAVRAAIVQEFRNGTVQA